MPDYELDERLELREPEQFKAMGDPLRQKILGLLLERAATTRQLAEALACPIGTTGHHLHVLLDAGLIRVVRTRQVRAMTEKYYGRAARVMYSYSDAERVRLLQQAMREVVPQPDDEDLPFFALRHVRVRRDNAATFAERLYGLIEEFGTESVAGERVYGVLAGVFLTDWPELPTSEQEGVQTE